jgi:hypothetical protein
MINSKPNNEQEEAIKDEVFSELNQAKQFAKSLNFDDVKSGQWFVNLLQKVVHSYDRNARAKYFQQKYPGLPPDEIADILTSVTVRYAVIAGGNCRCSSNGKSTRYFKFRRDDGSFICRHYWRRNDLSGPDSDAISS